MAAGAITIRKLTTIWEGSAPGLKRIGAGLLKVLTFSPADDLIYPQRDISVSIGKGNLSIAHGSRFLSRTTVNGTREFLFDEERYPQPEELVSSLALALNEFGAARTDITLSIPKAWTIIRTAEFPSTVKENMADVVAYEMDRITPFSAEEAFFDFRVVGETGDKITVLILAAKADALRAYIDALNENGFGVGRITVNLAGFGALCREMSNSPDNIFVSITDREYEGALFIDGSIAHVFSGSFGAPGANSKADVIASEVKALAETAKAAGRPAGVMVLFRDKDQAFLELLKVKVASPFKVMGQADAGLRFSSLPREVPFAAVGSLVDSLQAKVESPDLLRRGVRKKQKPPLALTFVLLLAIIVAMGLYLIAPLRVEEQRLAEMTRLVSSKKDDLKKVEALKKDAEALGAEIASIRSFKENKPLDLNIVKELTTILPKTTWLTRLRVAETTVDIEGYASSATEMLPKLEASKYFKKVEFASPTYRDARMNSDRFVIKMEIEGAVKTEDASKKFETTPKKAEVTTKKAEGEKAKNEKK